VLYLKILATESIDAEFLAGELEYHTQLLTDYLNNQDREQKRLVFLESRLNDLEKQKSGIEKEMARVSLGLAKLKKKIKDAQKDVEMSKKALSEKQRRNFDAVVDTEPCKAGQLSTEFSEDDSCLEVLFASKVRIFYHPFTIKFIKL
jgi:predicted  nucleic acid-binding Zn-ribbon protein